MHSAVMAMYEGAQTVARLAEGDSGDCGAFGAEAELLQESLLNQVLFVTVMKVITIARFMHAR